jgi:hypothetical protein
MLITYGPFTYDGISVRGPKDYLEARGVRLLDAILAGEDAASDPGGYPDEELAVLGRLDDDFQDWLTTAWARFLGSP